MDNNKLEEVKKYRVNKSDRVVYFDFLRIIATLMIVMIHNITYDISNYQTVELSVVTMYDSITRWGVPVFVMISGELFLGKDQPFLIIIKKNILRILTAFLFWSIFYTVWKSIFISEPQSLKYIIISIIRGHYHMWFLYMIMCLYLIIPFLDAIIKHQKLAIYFIALAFIFSFLIPQTVVIIGLKSNFISENLTDILSFTHMNFVLGFSGYFVLGYVLHKLQITKRLEIIIYIMGICGLIFTIVATIWVSKREQSLSEMFYDGQTVNILVMSIAVFIFAKQHLNKFPKREKTIRLLSYISKCTFGVYLVHPLVIDCLNRFVGVTTLSFNPILSIPVITLLVFLCSLGISAVLNKIPFVKRWFV